jgi:MFS family permease
MVLGLLPFFVITELRASRTLLGLMEGAAEALNYVLRVVAGFLTDRIGRRKPLILVGYALSTVSKPFFSVATSWSDALFVRVLDRAGKGIRTSPRDALISDSVSETKSGRAFGLHRSLDQIGAIIGPSLAFLLIPLIGIRGIFLASLIPGGIALLILLIFVVDRMTPSRPASVLANAREVLTGRFAIFLLVVGLFSVGAYNFSFVLVKAGTLGIGEGTIPLVYATLNAATVVAGLPAGILADRIGKTKMLMLSFGLLIASSLVSVAISNGAIFGYAIAFLYGLYLGTSDTVQRAIVPSLVAEPVKGTAYGIYYVIVAVCSLAANIAVGFLWDSFSAEAAFTYSIASSSLALVTLILVQLRGGFSQE